MRYIYRQPCPVCLLHIAHVGSGGQLLAGALLNCVRCYARHPCCVASSSAARTPNSNFLRGAKWSPDGACLLTLSDDNWWAGQGGDRGGRVWRKELSYSIHVGRRVWKKCTFHHCCIAMHLQRSGRRCPSVCKPQRGW